MSRWYRGVVGLFCALLVLSLVVMFLPGCGGGGGGSAGPTCTLSKNTVLVDQIQDLKLVSVDEGVYTYSYTDSAPEIKPGQILLSGEGKGYLRKVIAVEDLKGTLRVTTEQASLTDAFEELHFRTTIPVSKNVYRAGGGRIGRVAVRPGGEVGVNLDGISFATGQDYDLSIKGGAFNWTPTLDVGIDISDYKIRRFTIQVGGEGKFNLDADLKSSISGSISPPEKALTPNPIQIFESVIVIPPGVPILITGEFTCSVGTELSISSGNTMHLGFDSASRIEGGVEYSDGEFSPVSTFDYSLSPRMDSESSLEASIKVYIRPKVGVYIYSVAGPFVDVRPYGKLSLIVDSNPRYEAGIGIDGNVGGELKILSESLVEMKLKIFDLYYPVWTSPYYSSIEVIVK